MYRARALVDDGGRARVNEEGAIDYDAAPCGDGEADDECNNSKHFDCGMRISDCELDLWQR